jgi:hypothetical protein
VQKKQRGGEVCSKVSDCELSPSLTLHMLSKPGKVQTTGVTKLFSRPLFSSLLPLSSPPLSFPRPPSNSVDLYTFSKPALLSICASGFPVPLELRTLFRNGLLEVQFQFRQAVDKLKKYKKENKPPE